MKISALATSAVIGLGALAATQAAEAATFQQTQTRNLTEDGQSLFFTFDGLVADGSITNILVETGGSNFIPGIDLSGASIFEREYFDLTADDDMIGRYSCGGDANVGATIIPGTEGFMGSNCIFSLSVTLDAAQSDALLADGSLDIGVLFSDDVEAFFDNDEIEVSLTLQTIAPIPLPASLPLMAVGLGALGLYRRRRAR